MVVHLIHLGRSNTDGTVVGGKGLIQPGHHAPDAGGVIRQIDLGTIVGRVQGGIDSRNAASNDQDLHEVNPECILAVFFKVPVNEEGSRSPLQALDLNFIPAKIPCVSASFEKGFILHQFLQGSRKPFKYLYSQYA
jgi:hypothetical protein